MAESVSSVIRKKRKKLRNIRNADKKRVANTARKNRIKTYISHLEDALAKKLAKEEILKAFSDMQRELMRGANKKVIHKNKASRKISRMFTKVKAAISA